MYVDVCTFKKPHAEPHYGTRKFRLTRAMRQNRVWRVSVLSWLSGRGIMIIFRPVWPLVTAPQCSSRVRAKFKTRRVHFWDSTRSRSSHTLHEPKCASRSVSNTYNHSCICVEETKGVSEARFATVPAILRFIGSLVFLYKWPKSSTFPINDKTPRFPREIRYTHTRNTPFVKLKILYS